MCSVCNMAFESGVASEKWRTIVTASMYKGKERMSECNDYTTYSDINFLSGWRNLCGGISGQSSQSDWGTSWWLTVGFQTKDGMCGLNLYFETFEWKSTLE